MKDKGAVGANLYIEDSPDNIRALRSAGCEVIRFGNSTNVDVVAPRLTSWRDVEELVRQRFDAWSKPRSRP